MRGYLSVLTGGLFNFSYTVFNPKIGLCAIVLVITDFRKNLVSTIKNVHVVDQNTKTKKLLLLGFAPVR